MKLRQQEIFDVARKGRAADLAGFPILRHVECQFELWKEVGIHVFRTFDIVTLQQPAIIPSQHE